MNWILNPSLEVDAWQVEDYRSMPIDEIFERLEDKKINLTKTSFLGYAESVDTPEELSELLAEDHILDVSEQDQVYLLLFELWRRFLPEKQSLSIFCDELDHQIHLYDQKESVNMEEMQDLLANLVMILDENTDQGANPHDVFKWVSSGCANDLESFLYDFISQQVDDENTSYASELLESFKNYITEDQWFAFLRTRILASQDLTVTTPLILRLIKNCASHPDLLFNLELLSFMVGVAERTVFQDLVKKTFPLLENEEDFQNLLAICADFYHRLDLDEQEASLQHLLNKRASIDIERPFERSDPQSKEFLKIIG